MCIVENCLVTNILPSKCWVECFVFLFSGLENYVLVAYGLRLYARLRIWGKEHGVVGNGYTNFLPMRSVSYYKGGGFKISRFGGLFLI